MLLIASSLFCPSNIFRNTYTKFYLEVNILIFRSLKPLASYLDGGGKAAMRAAVAVAVAITTRSLTLRVDVGL